MLDEKNKKNETMVRRFQRGRDLGSLEAFLRDRFFECQRSVSWLPERLHDLIYRVRAQEADEGRAISSDYIYLWEENGEILACILPDGENIYFSVKTGHEALFPSMIAFSEKHCLPLFTRGEDKRIKFWAAVPDGLPWMYKTLANASYQKYLEEEYMNCICPVDATVTVKLPGGFQLLYGEEYPDEGNKWSALRLGFHPEWEAPDYRAGMNPYRARKESTLYPTCFECIVIDQHTADQNNVCSYCFVYVDHQTKTALIEPLSVREKYRRLRLGTAMLHGTILRCNQYEIEKCYVDSFGWRKDFYTAAGFTTEDSIGFWYKIL